MTDSMAILTLGVSYRRAPIELLDKLAFTDEDYPKAFRRARDSDALDELAVLSTCNRIELYAAVPNYHTGFLAMKQLLCESRDVDPEEVADALYSHFELHAAEHLFSVAAGLDSMVIGEQQIYAQVRSALRRADAEGLVGPNLAVLFSAAARAGRRARSETGLGAAPGALVETAIEVAGRTLSGVGRRRVVVVGAGQISELAVRQLRDRGVGRVRILNRTVERARSLAERTDAEHGDLDALAEEIAKADLVVSATGSARSVISADDVRRAMQDRGRDRPLVMLDLAVPRDVEPEAAGVDGVTLLDLDALKRPFDESAGAGGSLELARASEIVAEEVRRFDVRRRSERVAPLIRSLRARGEDVMAAELARFEARLADLTPAEREAVEALARGIVSKLLHDPIVQLKERSASGTDDVHAKLLAELFDIELDPPV
jgi:glutamyl-tRNA reductase